MACEELLLLLLLLLLVYEPTQHSSGKPLLLSESSQATAIFILSLVAHHRAKTFQTRKDLPLILLTDSIPVFTHLCDPLSIPTLSVGET